MMMMMMMAIYVEADPGEVRLFPVEPSAVPERHGRRLDGLQG